MQIDIYANGFTTTGALRAHVTRRLRYAFGCCTKRISRIMVRLSDINGPRGGVDKRCQIQVRLAALSDMVIEDTEADMYVASISLLAPFYLGLVGVTNRYGVEDGAST